MFFTIDCNILINASMFDVGLLNISEGFVTVFLEFCFTFHFVNCFTDILFTWIAIFLYFCDTFHPEVKTNENIIKVSNVSLESSMSSVTYHSHQSRLSAKYMIYTRLCNQRIDPNGDPTRNPTQGGRGRAGQAFYGSRVFKSGLLVYRNSGFFQVNPRKSIWNPNFLKLEQKGISCI